MSYLKYVRFLCSGLKKRVEYKLISPERHDDVIEHLRQSFFADEPLIKSVGLCRRGEGHKDLERYSLDSLENHLSVMAVDDNDKIAGVSLNDILRPGDVDSASEKIQCNDDEKFRKILKFLCALNLKVDLFQQFNVDKAFDIHILSVDDQFRCQGIANQLIKCSEQMARANGFRLMKAEATSLFTQKIFKSLGFEVVYEQHYDSYKDECEEPIFKVEVPHTKVQLVAKKLE